MPPPEPPPDPLPPLDTTFVREQFPAFSEPSLADWAFFENAGGSYACRQVIDRLTTFYTKTKVQPYQPYPASQAAAAAMEESHVRLAAYLGVGDDEIHFGPSTSQNTYVLARALRPLWRDGDEIVVTDQDHEANSGAWRRLAETGIVVREWTIDPATGALDPAALADLLGDRTKLVALPHCSNVVAEVNPLAEISALAHAAGALVVADGVAYAPHGLPDVAALGADVYLFSLYKTWGPHLGVMTVRRELLAAAANEGHFFNAGVPRKRLVPAGPDHAQVAAAAGVADYLDLVDARHFAAAAAPAERGRRLARLFQAHESGLLAPLLAWLRGRDDVRILGPDEPARRAPTVSLLPLRRGVAEVHRELTARRLMTGRGHFFAVRPLAAMGVATDPGVLRLSLLHYTTRDDVERLIAGLEAALGRQRA
ncbi:MAG: aminotransferase class V-fold PLP-dependent enzyme [Acidobacteriota bacterium]|nr:aminotransferase class V-fold PLP-dependent enzyme [Acidobacteriota bacterium]